MYTNSAIPSGRNSAYGKLEQSLAECKALSQGLKAISEGKAEAYGKFGVSHQNFHLQPQMINSVVNPMTNLLVNSASKQGHAPHHAPNHSQQVTGSSSPIHKMIINSSPYQRSRTADINGSDGFEPNRNQVLTTMNTFPNQAGMNVPSLTSPFTND